MKGRITTIIRKRETPRQKENGGEDHGGYGFIRDENDQDRFFHANDLRGFRFGEAREGEMVEFKPVNNGDKLRACEVKRYVAA